MEGRPLLHPRIRQEARRCLASYHSAYRQRCSAEASRQVSGTAAAASAKPGPATAAPQSQLGRSVQFYRGEIPASPGAELVDELLAYGGEPTMKSSSCGSSGSGAWSPDVLEYRHDYIQWLFPLRERGVNGLAPLLTTADAEALRRDGLAMARVLQAVRVMLRFYGTEIRYTAQPPAGPSLRLQAALRRTRDEVEWAAQCDNLSRRPHNYLRISRILQFLGEVGLEPLKLGWLEYLAREAMSGVAAEAPLAACRDSFSFWVETPYEERDRKRVERAVAAAAALTAPTPGWAGPVVTVEGLELPADLTLERVLRGPAAGEPGDLSRSAGHPTTTRKGKRLRE